MSTCPLVVLACESLHVCTVCIWRREHARFCVEVFYALYINFHSFIHSITDSAELSSEMNLTCVPAVPHRDSATCLSEASLPVLHGNRLPFLSFRL